MTLSGFKPPGAGLLAIALLTALLAHAGPATAGPQRAPVRYIFVIPLSHLDIGFNYSVPEVIALQKTHLDQAMDLAEQEPAFRWCIESVWQLEQWLAQTDDPQQINRLRGLIDQGRIELTAGYANMHQGQMGSEEFNRFLYPARRIASDWGLTLDTAVSDDVPGSSWALPQVLARNGVRNLVAGINTGYGGKPDIPIADYLFNWQGVDGSKVLTWVSVLSYAEGIFKYTLGSGYDTMSRNVQQIVDIYENAGYPYDAVMALTGFDNDGPDTLVGNGLANIARWNQEHTWPQIVVSTPSAFFSHIRSLHTDDEFSVYAGDWSGRWENDMRTPVSIAENRWVKSAVPQAETLAALVHAMDTAAGYPATDIEQVYRGLLTWDEHSGPGAGFELTRQQTEESNLWFRDLTLANKETTGRLLEQGLRGLSRQIRSAQPALLVYNPSSWPRDDLVYLPPTTRAPGQLVDLASGQAVEVQLTADTGRPVFLARNVPAWGYRLYGLPVTTPPVRTAPAGTGGKIESAAYRIVVDRETGDITSIHDKLNNRELVDPASPVPFNRLIRADQANAFVYGQGIDEPPGTVQVSAFKGPVLDQLIVSRELSPLSQTVISLPAGLSRVDIRNRIDHDRTRYADLATHTWWYYAAMPFALSGKAIGRFQSPNGWPRAQQDWIPGTAHNTRISRHATDLRDPDGFGITLATRESQLGVFGSLPFWSDEQPDRAILYQTLFARSDEADTLDQGPVAFPTWEPGAARRYDGHFSLMSATGGFNAVAATRHGAGHNAPLLVLAVPPSSTGALTAPAGSLLSISHPNVIATTLKVAEFDNPDGRDLILRLVEIAGQPAQELSVGLPFGLLWAETNDLSEQRDAATALPANPLSVSLGPHEVATIRLRPGPGLAVGEIPDSVQHLSRRNEHKLPGPGYSTSALSSPLRSPRFP